MVDLYLQGPDALTLLSDLGVNSFEDFRDGSPPQAKQLVACNPEGYLIGDSILFYLEEETYLSVGHWNLQNWLLYNLDIGDYDATARVANDPITEGPVEAGRSYPSHDGPPEEFRFEIQGPNALEVMDEVTDHPLPDISFFGMDTITIDGVEIYVLAHGMSSVPGWEIFGPYEHHDEVKSTILDAGAEYGIRHVGRKSYLSGTVPTGWFPVLIPAIYERSGSASVKEGNRIPLNEGFTDVEPRVEWMAEHGIDRTLVSVSTPNPLAGAFTPEQSTELVTSINDRYAAARDEHPDVFAGLGMLPLREPEAAVREVDRVANELQLSSIALPTSIPEGKLSSEDLRPTFEAVDDHDLTVFFHPHGNALSDSLGPEESFLSSLIVFEFDVVLPHMGGTLLHLGGRIDRGRQEFDEEDTDTIVADFRAVVTDDDDRRRVASETARTLFDL